MFDHFAWSVLATPLLVLLGTVWLAERVRADVALRVFGWTAVVAAGASSVTLVAFALKALAELPVVAGWGHWSPERVIADTAHVPWVSWVSLAWTCTTAVVVAIARSRRGRVLRAVRDEVSWWDRDGAVVVFDDTRVDAFAVPGERGGPGRIVVTTGMLDVLDEPGRAAVFAHERAHLTGGHHRLVWLARLAAMVHPVLWPVAGKVAYLAERAADEAAAAVLGDRRAAAKALGHAALAVSRAGRRSHGLPAASGSSPGAVPRRVSALIAPGLRRRWPVVLPVLLAAATVGWTGECVYDLFELLDLASAQ
ncbi:M48 family metalloprotease [Actinosynnema sp. CA-299493]